MKFAKTERTLILKHPDEYPNFVKLIKAQNNFKFQQDIENEKNKNESEAQK